MKGVNKMKKWLLLLIGMGILFTGCTSENTRTKETVETDTTIEAKKSKTQSTEQTTTEMKQSAEASTSESSITESSSEEVKNTLWDSEKSTQLATFVPQWGKTLGQEYKSYNLQNNVSLYGTPLPSAVIDGNWKMAINEAPVTVQWSEDGTGHADFNLVAVYSDVETGEYLGQHVYFFGFQNGQPKVYLTQQNQGNENNYLYFNETQNQQLKQGFSDIVNGQTPQTPVVEESTQQATTDSAMPSSHERAQAIREILKQNQGFNEEVLNSIPDEEILDSFVGNATNAQLAQSAMNLLEKYPNLK
ncbi:lipoprotein [Enterococcus faecium]|nr:lipoprotein [Enterococcus faecium]